MRSQGSARPEGDLALRVLRGGNTSGPITPERPGKALSLSEIQHFGFPNRSQPLELREWKRSNMSNLMRGVRKIAMAKALKIPTHYGQLWAKKLFADGRELDYGLVSTRVVTTTGVGFIVDAFQDIVELEIMKYHGMGVGVGAEAVGDTALGTELTTEYNPDNVRATGTLAEGSGANIFQTVGTNTIDSGTPAVTEHGILSQAAVGGGVLLDRSKFTAINLTASDGIEFTYELTVTAGG